MNTRTMPARKRPKPVILPGQVDGADLLGAISGPPSAYAEASLEAEAWRLGPGATGPAPDANQVPA